MRKQYSKYPNIVYVFLFLLFGLFSWSQDNDFIKISDKALSELDSCLSNKYDFSKFKLIKLSNDITLDSISIKVASNY